ncbi:uncharacterized protein LOC129286406 [Prosopis cineraria]|uniref:uncharacterized protein LOC129286406 n=1 Tax=Prosopis cineraria TaxID=364024 RepID=UPI00240F3A09|nr:uncharacterized protein LOC129286406 [Prosopis cineraria]
MKEVMEQRETVGGDPNRRERDFKLYCIFTIIEVSGLCISYDEKGMYLLHYLFVLGISYCIFLNLCLAWFLGSLGGCQECSQGWSEVFERAGQWYFQAQEDCRTYSEAASDVADQELSGGKLQGESTTMPLTFRVDALK